MSPQYVRRPHGFTLVEMLVVISIIALLIALLLPSLARSKELALSVKCRANAYGIGRSTMTYGNDNKDQLVNPYVTVATNAPIASQGRFIGGVDPHISPTNADNTLFGTLVPRAGYLRFYADVLVDGGYTTDALFTDPGRPAKCAITVATNTVSIAGLPGAYKTNNAAGTVVPAFRVRAIPMQYNFSIMFDQTTQGNTSVRVGTVAQQYYTPASGMRHMKISTRPWPVENAWVTCTPMISTGPVSFSSWGYPQSISPLHPSSGGTTNGVNAVFFDGHGAGINRNEIYFNQPGGPAAFTAAGAGENGGTWPGGLFRGKYWDVRNVTPLGGPAGTTNIGACDSNNIATGSVTP